MSNRPGFALHPVWIANALIALLAAWVLHVFVEALLAAAVTAVASWPLYRRFVERVGPRLPRACASLLFTSLITVFVLGPLVFASLAFLTEAQALVNDVAAADRGGIGVPRWLGNVPVVGSWLANLWATQLAYPGALAQRTEHADPVMLLTWLEQVGRFTAHHALVITFTILTLFFFYQSGDSIAEQGRRLLRENFEDGERYLDLATLAVQGSLQSMVIVALFDGLLSAVVFALLGVPHAALWGAIIGLLALVPFLGYVAVIVLACQLAIKGAAFLALLSLGIGIAILLLGDKVLRPLIARRKASLPFVWFLMGCLGGFEVLGPVGLVLGPVVLTVARELWQQRTAGPTVA